MQNVGPGAQQCHAISRPAKLDRSRSLCKRWLCCDGVLHMLQVEQHHGKASAHGHCHSGRVLCPAAATGKNRAMLEDCWKSRNGWTLMNWHWGFDIRRCSYFNLPLSCSWFVFLMCRDTVLACCSQCLIHRFKLRAVPDDVSDVHSMEKCDPENWVRKKYVLMVHVIAFFPWPVGTHYSLQKKRYQKHTKLCWFHLIYILISAFSGLSLFLWSLLSQLSWRQQADGRCIDKEDALTVLVQPSKFVFSMILLWFVTVAVHLWHVSLLKRVSAAAKTQRDASGKLRGGQKHQIIPLIWWSLMRMLGSPSWQEALTQWQLARSFDCKIWIWMVNVENREGLATKY